MHDEEEKEEEEEEDLYFEWKPFPTKHFSINVDGEPLCMVTCKGKASTPLPAPPFSPPPPPPPPPGPLFSLNSLLHHPVLRGEEMLLRLQMTFHPQTLSFLFFFSSMRGGGGGGRRGALLESI